ncbi:hypothetical protein JOD54_003817 [Actinokineospora baliensis]|uniref:DUF7711 family protein n=1 Tax=Actinokineospora baliensis TaxID=547056 RepID=UPI00195CDAB6|nr:hypothetical protein [Actinokineospora baliensis]MBM7773613.1 hypothetical protein [Actinokineospora baliensis]
MNWTRAVHHLTTLATTCADMATRPASIFPLRVDRLWAAGGVLGRPRELETITVALSVDVEEVPWRTEPSGSRHWAAAARLPQTPATAYWRSNHAPVWNHVLERPVLVWSVDGGVDEAALAAIGDGEGEALRPQAPSADELAERLAAELALSLRALRGGTDEYERRRWKPGKLEPVSDALWQASAGYLDLLDVIK